MNMIEMTEKLSGINWPRIYEKFEIILGYVGKFIEHMPEIIDGFNRLPGRVQVAARQWADYGWVPSLPEDPIIMLLEAFQVPETQKDADSFMSSRIKETGLKTLFDAIQEKVKSNKQNIVTYRNAISCFNSKAYTGCALCLFAIIDSCFIIGQPKSDKKNRDLAKRASQRAFDEDGSAFFVVAHTVKIIIEKLFSGGKDFDLTIENGMNRNFVSHGMNLYNPTRTDCLKLFVLLYNIYLMFDSELFRWESGKYR